MRKITARTMSIAGFLIALSVVLSRFIALPGIISFGGLPIIFAGIGLGPILGGIVGALGDIVKASLFPTGPMMPHFILTSALTGIIPGLITIALKTNLSKPKLWKIFLAILAGQVVTTVLLVPYFRHILFGHPLFVTMGNSIIRQAVNIPLYSLIIKGLLEALSRAGVMEKA